MFQYKNLGVAVTNPVLLW